MKIFTILTSFFTIIILVTGNFRIIPDERYQYCDESAKFLREGDIVYGNITDVDISYIMIDENSVVINGTVTFIIPIEQETFSTMIVAEKFEMGEWHKRHEHVIMNSCKEIFNPLGMYYPYSKDLPRCLYEPGVSFILY